MRAVEQAPDNAIVAASPSAVSTVAPSHSASNAQPKRVARVQLQPQVFRLDAEDGSGPVDLTIYDISQNDQVELETMYAALDVCNEHAHEGLRPLDARNQHVHSVRALQKRSEATIDIILDSGADCSALPLEYAHVGHDASGHVSMAGYVDAQGNPLKVKTTRDAEVTLGATVVKERFVVAPVTSPLICLGHLYKAAYFVQPRDGGLVLTNGSDAIPMGYRNQSFVIKGTIRMLAGHLRVVNFPEVYLLPVLENLRGSWTNIGNGVIACKSMSLNFLDTTLIPRDSVFWKRTTLVQRKGKWHMEEFCEDLMDLDDFEGPLQLPEQVEGMITLAYDNADLVPLQLGFELVNSSQHPSGQVPAQVGQVPAGSQEPSGQVPAQVGEVPSGSQEPSGQTGR